MSDLRKASKYAVQRKRHSIWRNVVTGIAAVVVFCTTYALILPAITMESEPTYCGFEDHEHTEECYELVCGVDEFVPHYHTDECYMNAEGNIDRDNGPFCHKEETTVHVHSDGCKVVLTCELEEYDPHPQHTDACYGLHPVLICEEQEAAAHAHDENCYVQGYTCGLAESEGHTHGSECCDESGELVCTVEESDGHTHSDACLGQVLSCGLEETDGHTHDDTCYEEQNGLICTSPVGEGHTHDSDCYETHDTFQCGHPEGKVVHQHNTNCYRLICEEHVHTEECYVKPEDAPAPKAQLRAAPANDPTVRDLLLEVFTEEELQEICDTYPEYTLEDIWALLNTPMTLEGNVTEGGQTYADFEPSIVKSGDNGPQITLTYADSDPDSYSMTALMHYSVDAQTIKNNSGYFYLDLDSSIKMPAATGVVKDGNVTAANYEIKIVDGHPRYYIHFLPEYYQTKTGPVTGEIELDASYAGTRDTSNNNVSVKILNSLDVTVKSDDINYTDYENSHFDLSINKECIGQTLTSDGKRVVEYQVRVSSGNGTPGVIDFVDTLQTANNATLQSISIDGVEQNASSFTGKQINLQLSQLDKNQSHVIRYKYEFPFNSKATESVSAHNKATAESTLPFSGGKLHVEDDHLTVTVTPPGTPGIEKTGSLDEQNKEIDWTIRYNNRNDSDRLPIAGEKIHDPNFSKATSLVVKANGVPLTAGVDYVLNTGDNTITFNNTTAVGNNRIEITYSTPVGTTGVGDWNSTSTETNKASYVSDRYPDDESEFTVEKNGGEVHKRFDHFTEGDESLAISWIATIKPALNGIPKDTVFVDVPSDNQYFDPSGSVEVYYYANGQQLVAVQNKNVAFKNANGETASGTQQAAKMEVTFTENPFASLPEGAENADSIVIKYSTLAKDGVPTSATTFSNDGHIGDKGENPDVTYYPQSDTVFKQNRSDESQWVTPDYEKDRVTLPWKFIVTPANKKIVSPIIDWTSVEGKDPHYFDPTETITIRVFEENSWTIKRTLTQGTDFTVTYYDGFDSDGNPTDLGTGKKTVMKIDMIPTPFLFTGNENRIQVVYNTYTDGIPVVVDRNYGNEVKYRNASHAIDQSYSPPKPSISKSAGTASVSEDKETITMPWSVRIAPNGVPITKIHEQITEGDHYFIDTSAVVLKYEGQSFGPSFEKKLFETVSVSENPDANGSYTYTTGSDGSGKYKYMEITVGDIAEQYKNTALILEYSTYAKASEGSQTYKNRATVYNQVANADQYVKESTAQKRVVVSDSDWRVDFKVEDAEATGDLKPWALQVTTGSPSSSSEITILDTLPQYVKLKPGIRFQIHPVDTNTYISSGPSMADPGITMTSGGESDSFSFTWVSDDGKYTVSGTYQWDEEAKTYVLSAKVKANADQDEVPQCLPPNTQFTFYIQPYLDIDQLPKETGKDWKFTNNMLSKVDDIEIPSSSSTQEWEDERPDDLSSALSKSMLKDPYGDSKLHFTVEINPDALDLDPTSNMVYLEDELVYMPEYYTHSNVGVERLKYFLYEPSVKLYYAKKMQDGSLEILDSDAEVSSTKWRWTSESYEASGYGNQSKKTLKINVPDQTCLILKYTYDIDLELKSGYTLGKNEPGKTRITSVPLNGSNTVKLLGRETVNSEENLNQDQWDVSNNYMTASSGHTITISKVESGNYGLHLAGAQFTVQSSADGVNWTTVQNKDGSDYIIYTDEYGKILISANSDEMDKNGLNYNTLYRVIETTPPPGYLMPDTAPEVRFYISGPGGALNDTLKKGATDLATDDVVTRVYNTNNKAKFSFEKVWKKGDTVVPGQNVNFVLYRVGTNKPVDANSLNDPLVALCDVTIRMKDYSQALYEENVQVPEGTTFTVHYLRESDDPYNFGYNNDSVVNGSGDVPMSGYVPVYKSGTNVVIGYDVTYVVRQNGLIECWPVTGEGYRYWVTSSYSAPTIGGDVTVLEEAVQVGDPISLGAPGNVIWNSAEHQDTHPTPIRDSAETMWYSYYVVEQSSSTWQVFYSNKVGENYQSVTSGVITVTNVLPEQAPVTLPETGGVGLSLFMMAGGGLTGGAAAGLAVQKYKPKRKRGRFER